MNKFILPLVLIFFLVTRLFQITDIPSSVYWDEASIGYNAYSIITTGKDEWGKSFPLHFRAFGEFKLPVYIYSVAISEKIFGLNNFAVRFPAVAYSGLTLVIVYLIARKLTGKEEIGLLSAFVLSVMPWFFIFSRTGYEATAGLMFYSLGFLLLLYADKKRWLILLSVLSFILSLYSYNSYRIISPITFVLLTVGLFYRKPWKKTLAFFIPSVAVLLISLIPVVRLIIYDAGFGRAEGFSLIPHIQQVYDLQGKPHFQLIYDRSKQGDWGANVLGVVKNYFSHLSPQFLFIKGDGNPRDLVPGFGTLFWIDLFFILEGIFFLVKKKVKRLWLPVLLILLSFVPPSLFKESPHALRSLSAAPFLAILIALGIYNLTRFSKKVLPIVVVVYLIFFSFLFTSYIQSYNAKTSQDWQVGYKTIFTQYASEFPKYNKIIISDNEAQPYIFGLYYLKYDPRQFRTIVSYNSPSDWGFSTVRSFGKFLFVKDKEIANIKDKGVLIFASPSGEQKDRTPQSVIKSGNGQISFYVYSQ